MTRKILVISMICAALAATPTVGSCASTARTEAAVQIADAFFAVLKSGQTKEAFNRLFAGTEVMAKKQADIDVVIGQVESASKYYGAIQEPEFVSEQDIGSLVARQIYVLRTERGPLFWTFYFYKRGNVWTTNTVDFDDNIRNAFK